MLVRNLTAKRLTAVPDVATIASKHKFKLSDMSESMNKDLTQGPVMRSMLLFAVPMILGNLLQQCYNIADTLIVGQCLGKNALAAVGLSFTLMTFLTSILLYGLY